MKVVRRERLQHAAATCLIAMAACEYETPSVSCVGIAHRPIVGGVDVSDVGNDAIPTGAIRMIYPRGIEHPSLCTGTSVAPLWVLTAAHCSQDPRLKVDVTGEAEDVAEIFVHPRLDLALMRTSSPAFETLPTTSLAELSSDDVWLAGYGDDEHGAAGVLRFVEERIVSSNPDTVTVDGLGVTGACRGDSGGPLLGVSGSDVGLIGVLSVGSPSCRELDVYTRADIVLPWIQAIAENNDCP